MDRNSPTSQPMAMRHLGEEVLSATMSCRREAGQKCYINLSYLVSEVSKPRVNLAIVLTSTLKTRISNDNWNCSLTDQNGLDPGNLPIVGQVWG